MTSDASDERQTERLTRHYAARRVTFPAKQPEIFGRHGLSIVPRGDYRGLIGTVLIKICGGNRAITYRLEIRVRLPDFADEMKPREANEPSWAQYFSETFRMLFRPLHRLILFVRMYFVRLETPTVIE